MQSVQTWTKRLVETTEEDNERVPSKWERKPHVTYLQWCLWIINWLEIVWKCKEEQNNDVYHDYSLFDSAGWEGVAAGEDEKWYAIRLMEYPAPLRNKDGFLASSSGMQIVKGHRKKDNPEGN